MEYIIKDLTIFYGSQLEERNDYAIWIKDGKFYKLLPSDQIPGNVKIVSKKGKYLLPGLIDLHLHTMWDGSSDPVGTTERESYEQMIIRAISNYNKYIQNGITTIRDLGSIDDIALHLTEAIDRRLIKGSRLIASGKTITMTGGHDPFWARFADGPQETLRATREQIYKNAQVIKVSATGGVYGRSRGESVHNAELTFEELRVICDEAHRFNLKVCSHAIGREGIINSVKAGVDNIEHGHFIDEEIVELMLKNNTSWTPTIYTYQKYLDPTSNLPLYAKEKAKTIVEHHVESFIKYFNSGVLIGAGSDAGGVTKPHPSLLEELTTMDKYIKNKKDVIKTATINAGEMLDMKIGKIEEGYLADFILLNSNPLDNLKNLRDIDSVYVEGEKGA